MSKIEWLRGPDGSPGKTWNPIRARLTAKGRAHFGVTKKEKHGHFCVHVSEGCRNCYAERMQPYYGHGAKDSYRKTYLDQGLIEVYLDEKELLAPLKWRKAQRVFPCSMTDLFGEWVPVAWIDRIVAVIALTPHIDYPVLTKRAKGMREYMNDLQTRDRILAAMQTEGRNLPAKHPGIDPLTPSLTTKIVDGRVIGFRLQWPLPNLYLYVSIEDQATAARILDLLATPAAVRGVSYEPALGPANLVPWLLGWEHGPKLNHVIVGGESGPRARPMHPDWARKVRDDCAAAKVPFFLKQWGEYLPRWGTAGVLEHEGGDMQLQPDTAWPDGTIAFGRSADHGGLGIPLDRVGKKRAGRELDGREYNAMPGEGA